ncbi:hypothetical protein KIN20_030965 [Parelaphostrongylus tenuis]|uniref:Uncharacterized protein n=1 Tax=Parelaphostrongylus tenuis TaxID=148309 RepID=A0AAD5R4H3_PARTN|nr:hypothetical protein KIN20_030965 [Parelaphostrongylus tenuis]
MRCSKAPVGLALVIGLFFEIWLSYGCGIMPPGQERQISFTVNGFTLPVNLAWSSKATTVAKAPGLLGSAVAVQSFVQRLTMQIVTDVLEEQGRRAGLLPAVTSSILDQLSVRTNYSALECPDVIVNPGANNMPQVMHGTCIIIGDTVSSICRKMNAQEMCMFMMGAYADSVPTPPEYRTISGTASTTNILMANWSTQMWQNVMNRVARSLASGPFRSNFFGVSVTVSR